ncbi:GNAT family N-acetyltransferase [Nostoc sp. CHAB 5784]|uniref:GNAT family N-acetyltransferase n=1 Tax=Nostoc mirabile TaxID=2907820 RepID=UPI001E6460EF|nr:GNAT family N-acetyltransferase [Nostoc mirabile]MCC5670167.1 GNAT family N-acetyltransferase [Nostoc mirabile CHAB5784]
MHTTPLNVSSTNEVEPITATIESVTESNVADVVAVGVLAFNADPASRWLYSEPRQYLTYFPQFISLLGGKAFEHNTAYYIDDYFGAALWLPPGIEPDAQPLIDLIQHSVAEQKQADMFAVLEQMAHHHPTEPHWYLAILGVEPKQQGKGYGSALIQKILRECDRTQTPAYLESSNPSNVPFYERHGFEAIGTIQAGTSPTLFPMIRYPDRKTEG